jgi:hypothetical protein
MIRIDEIYNHTLWPWLDKNRPGYRLFFCDPFGRSDPDSICNFGNDNMHEHNYIFCFDQEPIHLDMHWPTFQKVENECKDITHLTKKIRRQGDFGYFLTSESNSENVTTVCKEFKWQSLYYFFHGWAALDWYRGYDKTFLISPPSQRKPTKTFISPNRIIGGRRMHRLEMLYYVFKHDMLNNYISCPTTCPAENINIFDAINLLADTYPDIQSVFMKQRLPMNFAGEENHPMHSCWLSLFDECADSLLYLVTETVATGRRHHLTEKTFKPIAMGMPFILVATKGSLEYLRSYGFQTFGHLWDESYDQADDGTRISCIANLLRSLNNMSVQDRQHLFYQALEVIEHNWNHFYNGGFELILWKELNNMLESINL